MYELLKGIWLLDTQFADRVIPLVLGNLQGNKPIENLNVINFRKRKHHLTSEKEALEMDAYLYFYSPENQPISAWSAERGGLPEKSTAIVEILGPITKWGDMCSYGTKDYIQSIEKALANPKVNSIVIHIDSPGGTVDGTEELANVIREAKKKKPIVAFADGLMASAAYWVGSQADFIYASSSQTSWIGSIGTLIMHVDQSGWLAKEGLKVTYLTADRSTEKVLGNSYEPLVDEAITMFKEDLNAVNSAFIQAVKFGRSGKLKVPDNKDIFTGATFRGLQAQNYGLVDGIGTLKNAVSKSRTLARAKEIVQN